MDNRESKDSDKIALSGHYYALPEKCDELISLIKKSCRTSDAKTKYKDAISKLKVSREKPYSKITYGSRIASLYGLTYNHHKLARDKFLKTYYIKVEHQRLKSEATSPASEEFEVAPDRANPSSSDETLCKACRDRNARKAGHRSVHWKPSTIGQKKLLRYGVVVAGILAVWGIFSVVENVKSSLDRKYQEEAYTRVRDTFDELDGILSKEPDMYEYFYKNKEIEAVSETDTPEEKGHKRTISNRVQAWALRAANGHLILIEERKNLRLEQFDYLLSGLETVYDNAPEIRSLYTQEPYYRPLEEIMQEFKRRQQNVAQYKEAGG